MRDIQRTRSVDRPYDAAHELFAGHVQGWLPVIVGPDEGSWRTDTSEGPINVEVLIETSPAFVRDGTACRGFQVRPDPTSHRNLLTAFLTPTLDGELILSPDGEDRSTLEFKGRTRARNGVTGAVERWLVGDPLAWSGIDTLLDEIARQLQAA